MKEVTRYSDSDNSIHFNTCFHWYWVSHLLSACKTMETSRWVIVALVLMGSIVPSYQWISLGSAASKIKETVSNVPNVLGNVETSIQNIFADRDPNKVIFEFSPAPTVIQQIDIHDPTSVGKTNYNSSRPTVLITHGFTPDFEFLSGSNTVFHSIADAYFQTGAELNLIAVNWEKLARPKGLLKPLHYRSIVGNVPIVGKRVADFVVYLMENAHLDLDNLHLIGFSLGAHVSGLAGSNILNMTGKLVRRITGLDPAAPEFYVPTTDASQRLDDTDAKFVIAIHTNVKANGLWYPVGNVDFYPNDGGPIQPACGSAATIFGYSLLYRLVCSHSQAYQFYAKSILKLYHGCPCDSVSDLETCEASWTANNGVCDQALQFGDRCPETAIPGIYFLKIELKDK